MSLLRINIGCGSQPLPGWVNCDIAPLDGVDVVHDLDVLPWPWKDDTAGEILAFDIYEHVVNWRGFMSECHRILEPGGMLKIHTAYWKNPVSYRDPDHKRFLTEESFDYWVPDTQLNDRYGAAYAGGCHFEKVAVTLDSPVGDLNVFLRKIGNPP